MAGQALAGVHVQHVGAAGRGHASVIERVGLGRQLVGPEEDHARECNSRRGRGEVCVGGDTQSQLCSGSTQSSGTARGALE